MSEMRVTVRAEFVDDVGAVTLVAERIVGELLDSELPDAVGGFTRSVPIAGESVRTMLAAMYPRPA